MPVSLRLTRDNIVSAQTQGSHPAITWRLFRRCEIGLARNAQIVYHKRCYFSKIPETGQARCQARHSGQTLRFYETQTGSAHASIHSCIYAIYVIGYLIPIFMGLVIYTLINRDLFVINLNGKYPKIFVTDFRHIWN